MSEDQNIPDEWSMPDDLAKQVNKALSRKSLTPEQELQDALDEMARDIALIEPDPEDWGWWVNYLFKQMRAEANRRRRIDDYENMLNSLLRNLSG
jgi:hypothetical protein